MQLEGRRGGIDEEGKKKQHQDIRSSSIKREQSRKVSEDCLLLSGLWAASASCPLRSPWTVASASSAALWLRDTERDEEQHKSDQKHQQWGLNFHTQMSFVPITAVNFVWITFCFAESGQTTQPAPRRLTHYIPPKQFLHHVPLLLANLHLEGKPDSP